MHWRSEIKACGLAIAATGAVAILGCERREAPPAPAAAVARAVASPTRPPPCEDGAGGGDWRPVLRPGATLDEVRAYLLQRGPVENIWPEPPRHLFTIQEGGETMAVSATLGHPSLQYCFVFRDGRLERALDGPLPDPFVLMTKSAVEGSWSEVLKWTEEVLASREIPLDSFERTFADELRALKLDAGAQPEPAEDASIPLQLMPSYALQKARLDPFRVRCGMRGSEVEALLGPLSRRYEAGDQAALLFDAAELGRHSPPSIVVLVENDLVQAILTGCSQAALDESSGGIAGAASIDQ